MLYLRGVILSPWVKDFKTCVLFHAYIFWQTRRKGDISWGRSCQAFYSLQCLNCTSKASNIKLCIDFVFIDVLWLHPDRLSRLSRAVLCIAPICPTVCLLTEVVSLRACGWAYVLCCNLGYCHWFNLTHSQLRKQEDKWITGAVLQRNRHHSWFLM